MLRELAFVAIAAGGAMAANRAIATITTPDAFDLNGVNTSAVGVSSWALAVGDEVTTTTAPAVIRFADKATVAIDKGTTLKLEGTQNEVLIRLTNGTMRFKVDPNAHIQVFAGAQRLSEAENGVQVQAGKVRTSKDIGPSFHHTKPPEKPPGRSKGDDDDRWHR